MKTIHKFELKIQYHTNCQMVMINWPEHSIPIHIEAVNDEVFLWATVDDKKEMVNQIFYIIGTGGDRQGMLQEGMKGGVMAMDHIGTFVHSLRGYVGHVFAAGREIF